MRGYMHALNPHATKPSQQPFSPVRMHEPRSSRLARHPRAAGARRLVCDVEEGSVLFIPSYWWHTVRATPAPEPEPEPEPEAHAAQASQEQEPPGEPERRGAGLGVGRECGLTASLNYFFTPFFRKGSDLRHFSHERFYDFVRARNASEATAADRWRQHAGAPQPGPTPDKGEL